jgi:plasmid stabilization system protein ParE
MSSVVVITLPAKIDIIRNAKWWSDNHSGIQAAEWLDAVETQIMTLNLHPESHPLAVENPRFKIDLREKLVGLGSRPNYRAIYTITGLEIQVLRVISASQDELMSGDLAGWS